MSTPITPQSIYFVDASLADLATLLAGLPEGAEVHQIGAGVDGVQLMADTLAGRSGVDAVHLLTHGSAGSVSLGASTLNSGNLAQYSAQWATVRAALTENADLLIYGCNVAQGEVGQAFVQQLAALTGADVAASDDLTGAAALGGDWDLEMSHGVIEASILAVDQFSEVLRDRIFTFNVNSSPNTQYFLNGIITTNGVTSSQSLSITGADGIPFVSNSLLPLILNFRESFNASYTVKFKELASGSWSTPSSYTFSDNSTYDNSTYANVITLDPQIEGIWNTAGTFDYQVTYTGWSGYGTPTPAGPHTDTYRFIVTSNTAPVANNGSDSGNEDNAITGTVSSQQ